MVLTLGVEPKTVKSYMSRSVERKKDANGRWWVLEDGTRKCDFPTRAEARLYASGGLDTQPQQLSQSRKALTEICDTYGVHRIRSLYRRLDPLDVRVITLHLLGATQAEVARNVGLTQPSVCYRLQGIVGRLKFLLDYPTLEAKQMREDLEPYFTDPMDVAILIMFVETTCQSLVAKRLGTTQGLVRHRILKALDKMSTLQQLSVYYKAVKMAQENINILNNHSRWDGISG